MKGRWLGGGGRGRWGAMTRRRLPVALVVAAIGQAKVREAGRAMGGGGGGGGSGVGGMSSIRHILY